jgi:urea transporter
MNKYQIKSILGSITGSYSQIFFSEDKIFGMILILVSFFDYTAGISGLISVIIADSVAYSLGFNRFKIAKGFYGFNSLLVGLGIGLNFTFSVPLIALVVFSSILTLFVSLAMEGVFAKYGLSYLSIPFLIGIWTVLSAVRKFTALKLSERGIYVSNELYDLGGKNLVDIYEYTKNIPILESIRIYLISLGAIFFQNNIFAGILISAGLLYYSRIAFSLSAIGFYAAYFFYRLIGADFYALSYSFIGFNYILTSIAIGGYFVIPSYKSYLWVLLMLPVTVIITEGSEKIFSFWNLSVYSLPFNIIVLLFVYILKLRYIKDDMLSDSFINYSSPEKNLYLNRTNKLRFKDQNYFQISLPFWGEWSVMQSHKGEYTHKDNWRHAWDFVIKDSDGKQFKNSGDSVEDYFCYGKSIIAPAGGYVIEIQDNIPDNKVGELNTIQNWGNSVVIKHTEFLYSQLSHLKPESLKVKPGDYVSKGQIIASVGNSGHSPFPHVHFQLQANPYIGSETLDYPLNSYILKTKTGTELTIFGKPEKDEMISPAQTDEVLTVAFHIMPGQKISAQKTELGKTSETLWSVEKDIYNETYIRCSKTGASAYYFSDGNTFFFQNYYGSTKSDLFLFFKSLYHVRPIFYPGIEIRDYFRTDLFFNKFMMFFQDFFAPFIHFVSAVYKIKYDEKDSDMSSKFVKFTTSIVKRFFQRKTILFEAKIIAQANLNFKISYVSKSGNGILKTKLMN